MRKFCFTIFILFANLIAFSQSSVVDSLKLVLKNAKHDTIRCNVLNDMIENESNDSIWPIYNIQLKEISKQYIDNSKSVFYTFFIKHYANSLNNFGYFYMQKGMMSSAYNYYYQALDIYQEINDKKGIALESINLGYLFRQDGNITKAIESYHTALKIQIEIKDKLGAATSYNNIGFIFDSQGESTKALEYYNKALDSYLQIKNSDGIANSYSNIAYIYKTYGDPSCKGSTKECQILANKIAINYLNKSAKIYEEMNDKFGLSNSLNLLGGIYDMYGDPDCLIGKDCYKLSSEKALEYYKKALALRIEAGNLSGISLSYNSLAEYMFQRAD